MRTLVLLCLVTLALLCGNAVIADSPDTQAALSHPVAKTTVQAKSLPDAAFALLNGAGVPVAVEGVGAYVCAGSQELTEKPVSLQLTAGTSIADALDAAIKQDPRYEWKVVGCWVHIMPCARKVDYILDKPFVGAIPTGGKAMTVLKQVMTCFPGGWSRAISFGGADISVRRDCSFVPENPSVREAIDIALWRSGISCWETVPSRGGKGKCVVAAVVVKP